MTASVSPELALILAALVGAGAVLDLRSGRIPNGLILVIAALGVVSGLPLGAPLRHLALAAAGIGVGLGFWIVPFALRWVGGADVKLVAAAGAWLGPLATLRLSLFAALAGGLLALLYLWLRSPSIRAARLQLTTLHSPRGRLPFVMPAARPRPSVRTNGDGERGMAYAVAIFIGLAAELALGLI